MFNNATALRQLTDRLYKLDKLGICILHGSTPAAELQDHSMADRITIRILGSERDGGDVRLSDFIDQLEAFAEALRQTERALSGNSSTYIYYKIVDLTHNSPATIVLEAVAKKRAPVTSRAVTKKFIDGVRVIRNKKRAPHGADIAMLRAYKALASPKKNIQRVELVQSSAKVIPIDSVFSREVDKIIGPDIYSVGSVSGRLESINLHNTLRFAIFPSVGPSRISCEFKSNLRPAVKEALDRYVTITGRLRYKEMDKYPYAIDVREIDIHEPDAELPNLYDIRGITEDSTEGQSAEDFVRSMRDANW